MYVPPGGRVRLLVMDHGIDAADQAILKESEAGDIDTAVITLKFANGAIGSIDNSRACWQSSTSTVGHCGS